MVIWDPMSELSSTAAAVVSPGPAPPTDDDPTTRSTSKVHPGHSLVIPTHEHPSRQFCKQANSQIER